MMLALSRSTLFTLLLATVHLRITEGHEGEPHDCPPRSTVTSTKTVTAGGRTPAPVAYGAAMKTVVVTHFHTVTRSSNSGGGGVSTDGAVDGGGAVSYNEDVDGGGVINDVAVDGGGDVSNDGAVDGGRDGLVGSFSSDNDEPSDPLNEPRQDSEEAVEYEYVYTDADGETFVDDASVLYLPTAAADKAKDAAGPASTPESVAIQTEAPMHAHPEEPEKSSPTPSAKAAADTPPGPPATPNANTPDVPPADAPADTPPSAGAAQTEAPMHEHAEETSSPSISPSDPASTDPPVESPVTSTGSIPAIPPIEPLGATTASSLTVSDPGTPTISPVESPAVPPTVESSSARSSSGSKDVSSLAPSTTNGSLRQFAETNAHVPSTEVDDIEEKHTHLPPSKAPSEVDSQSSGSQDSHSSQVPSGISAVSTSTPFSSQVPSGSTSLSAVSTSATLSALQETKSSFPNIVAGREYDEQMSYFKETQHGRDCSKPGGIYDTRGACGVTETMKELLDNSRRRVSVPQYLWDQFLPAGGAATAKSEICGRNITFKANNKEIKLMVADHMGENNFDMCLDIWEDFGYKADLSVHPVKFTLEPKS